MKMTFALRNRGSSTHWLSSLWGRTRAPAGGRRSGEAAAARKEAKLGVGAGEGPGDIGTGGAAAMAKPPRARKRHVRATPSCFGCVAWPSASPRSALSPSRDRAGASVASSHVQALLATEAASSERGKAWHTRTNLQPISPCHRWLTLSIPECSMRALAELLAGVSHADGQRQDPEKSVEVQQHCGPEQRNTRSMRVLAELLVGVSHADGRSGKIWRRGLRCSSTAGLSKETLASPGSRSSGVHQSSLAR
jgi:hypothetical protein